MSAASWRFAPRAAIVVALALVLAIGLATSSAQEAPFGSVLAAPIVSVTGTILTPSPTPDGTTTPSPTPRGTLTPAVTGTAGVGGSVGDVTGYIIALDTTSLPMRAFVHVDTVNPPLYTNDGLLIASAVPVLIADPALLPGLGPGVNVTFHGNPLVPIGLVATSLTINPPTIIGADVTTPENQRGTDASDNDSDFFDNSDYDYYDNSDYDNYESSPEADCIGEVLTIDPKAFSTRNVGTTHTVSVSLTGTDCQGGQVAVRFQDGSANPRATISPSDNDLDGGEQTTFTYTGANPGLDTFEVWVEITENGVRDSDEPSDFGSVTWVPSKATVTSTAMVTVTPTTTGTALATPTATGTALATPTASATPTVTRTPGASATPTTTGSPTPTQTATATETLGPLRPSSARSREQSEPSRSRKQPEPTRERANLADLSVSADAPLTAEPGEEVTFTITVANDGPRATSNLELTYRLARGMRLISVATSDGECVPPRPPLRNRRKVICNLESLEPRGRRSEATITVVVKPERIGRVGGLLFVRSDEADPNPRDNRARPRTKVRAAEVPVVTDEAEAPLLPGA